MIQSREHLTRYPHRPTTAFGVVYWLIEVNLAPAAPFLGLVELLSHVLAP